MIPRPMIVEGPAHRILLVEDYADGADATRMLLESWGYEVEVARDRAEALTCAGTRRPDAALLDLGLPTVDDGCALVSALRALPRGGELLIVALTGYAQETDRRQAIGAGCDFFFAKPADLDELREALSSIALHRKWVRRGG